MINLVPENNKRIPPLLVYAVGTISGSSIEFDSTQLVREVVQALNADPELAGIMVRLPAGRISVLSRIRLFETLSRPYGLEIFLNRPIVSLPEDSFQFLLVDSELGIDEVVRQALNRDALYRYEPVVMQLSDGTLRLVDLRNILLTQSSIMASSAAIVHKQVELAHALSGTLQLDVLLSQVLDSIEELMHYERAIIYMHADTGLVNVAERNGVTQGRVSVQKPFNPNDFADDEGWATFPLIKGDQAQGYLCVKYLQHHNSAQLREIIASFANSAALAIANARMYAHLEEIASLDQLTGALNRRAFIQEADRVSERATRDGRPISIIMLDLDRFKKINDTHGHGSGDDVLKSTMERAIAELRAGDVAGRFGGEEYVFLLPETESAAAGAAAERIRARIAAAPISTRAGLVSVTASLGIASAIPSAEHPLTSLIDAADVAMYRAKRAGRNRIRFAELPGYASQREQHTSQPAAVLTKGIIKKQAGMAAIHEPSELFMQAVSSILGTMSRGVSLEELAVMALESLRSIMPECGASLLLQDSVDGTLQLMAQRGLSDSLLEASLDSVSCLAGRASLERRILCVSRDIVESYTRVLATRMDACGFNQYCAFPMSASGKSLGVLEVFDNRQDKSDFQRFIAMVADALAIAASMARGRDEAETNQKELTTSYDETLEAWVRMLELRDQETEGHARRVTEMTMELAKAYGMPGDILDDVRRGALLHDIGKMGVPDSILLKNGPLTDLERIVISKHPLYANEVISTVPFLASAIDIPYCHHERWDGTGYPRGLSKNDIPLPARLFAVVDVWDALLSNRPYRAAMSADKAAAIIASGSGSQFDPDVVALFLELRNAEIRGLAKNANHNNPPFRSRQSMVNSVSFVLNGLI